MLHVHYKNDLRTFENYIQMYDLFSIYALRAQPHFTNVVVSTSSVIQVRQTEVSRRVLEFDCVIKTETGGISKYFIFLFV